MVLCELDLHAEFVAKNTRVFGVSFDSVDDNRAFAEKFRFNFPLLSDTSRETGAAYGALASPTATTAKRISVLIGADGRVERVWPKVDTATHPAEVLALL